jgi:ABC-type branched-subunit amino acid transport system substrate-binding protein
MQVLRGGLAIGLLAVCAGAANAQALPDRIKMGGLFVATGPAVQSFFSTAVAMRMVVRDINAAGGIAGKQIDLVEADTQFPKTEQAVQEARRLTGQEKVHFVAGPWTTQESLAVAPVMAEADVLYLTTAAATVFNAKSAPTGFSTYLNIGGQTKAMVDFAKNTLKAKSIAVITDSGAQGKDAANNFRRLIAEAGLKLAAEQEHEPAATDVTPQLLSMRRSGADVLLQVASSGQDAGQVFKGMAEIGWDVPVVSQVAAVTLAPVLRVAGNGVFKSGRNFGVNYKAFMYCPNDPVGQSPFGKWVSAIKEFSPKDFPNLSLYSMSFAYDGVYFTKAAIEATRSVSGKVLAKWLEDNSSKLSGVSGPADTLKDGSRHLFGPGAIGFTNHPDEPRSDNLTPRWGC